MSARSTEHVARGVFAALDRRDLVGVAEFLAEDDVQDFVPIGLRRGRAAVVAVFAELFAAVPDSRMTVEEVLVGDDRACVRWRLSGTFTGEPFQGILATARPIDLRGADAVIEVKDGLISLNTIFYDGAAFARQVGVLPGAGSPLERLLIAGCNLCTRLRRLTGRLGSRR
jgi:ketosteroid isomerase-like protein